MKKNLLVFACFVSIFSACKKDTSKSAANVITATVNSTNINFSTAVTGQVKSISGSYLYSLQFIGSTSNNEQKLSLTIFSKTPIVKGTYSMDASDTTAFPQLTYVEDALSNTPLVFSGVGGAIIITAISSTNVQGTFNSNMMTQPGTAVSAISNGKFNIAL